MPTLTPSSAADLFRHEPARHLAVGSGQVAHRRVGTGPDVLFVHGWPVSGATFRTLLPFLSDHVTCHVIDLPGGGSSRFTAATNVSIGQHIMSVRRVVDLLGLDDVAVVGHDSGGMIARHAFAGDGRLRSMGLIDTEQTLGPSRRFKMFVAARHAPGLAPALGWVSGRPRLRRSGLVLGDAFADRSLLDGEFDEFFLAPLHDSPPRRAAAARTLRSYDHKFVRDPAGLHHRIPVPVQLVWGDQDRFFPLRSRLHSSRRSGRCQPPTVESSLRIHSVRCGNGISTPAASNESLMRLRNSRAAFH